MIAATILGNGRVTLGTWSRQAHFRLGLQHFLKPNIGLRIVSLPLLELALTLFGLSHLFQCIVARVVMGWSNEIAWNDGTMQAICLAAFGAYRELSLLIINIGSVILKGKVAMIRGTSTNR
jgi:hypothetical protein